MNRYFKLFVFLSLFFVEIAFAEIERRAAIDIGSGGTKLTIADVDSDSNLIMDIKLDTSFSVPYQASLDRSSDGTFDKETCELALKTFKQIKELTNEYQVKKIAAIATSAFRKSNNSNQLVADIKKLTNIHVKVIPQREEGEIAFFSALSNGNASQNDAVVLDVGTGSLQLTTRNEKGNLSVYMGEHMGSVAFKSFIIDTIQGKNLETTLSPNPVSFEELRLADRYVRSFARKAYPIFKEKIKTSGSVMGIGRLFYHSVRPIAAEDGVITRKGLRKFIYDSLNKNDDELNNPYAHVDVSNCILVLAMMKALHIQEIHPIDTTSTRGMLISPAYY